MKMFLYQTQWNWKAGGIALGLTFLLAVALVKPIGVSTQFVILDAITWDTFSSDLITQNEASKSGYSSSNAYLNKSGGAYAADVENPLTYSLIFAFSMILGGFLAKKTQSDQAKSTEPSTCPRVWKERFGGSSFKRHLATFTGGALALIGARLAGGCTSGHMMSGIMQTSVSGYLFAIATFAAAVPVAILMYRRGDS